MSISSCKKHHEQISNKFNHSKCHISLGILRNSCSSCTGQYHASLLDGSSSITQRTCTARSYVLTGTFF